MSKPSSLVIAQGDGRFGREVSADYNEVNLLETDDQKVAKVEMWIAKQVGETLVNNYPNRQWGVRVDAINGLLIITCDSISLEKGYHIFMAQRTIEELQRRAIFAAAEILERHGLSRDKKFDADILETLPRDFKDNVIVGDSSADAEPIDQKPKRD